MGENNTSPSDRRKANETNRNLNDKQLIGLLAVISIMSKRLAKELAKREGANYGQYASRGHEQFGEIRTLTKDGEIRFVATDVVMHWT